MVVDKNSLGECIKAFLPEVSKLSDLPSKDMYLIGGCGLLMHAVFDKRNTEDMDIYFPDAPLLPIYSERFHDSGYAGVTYELPQECSLEKVELFHLLENEALEDYIMKNSEEIYSGNGFRVMLSPLEALIANKVRSYSACPDREKDLWDVMSALDLKRQDIGFETKLKELLHKTELYDKYKDMFGEYNCRSGASIYMLA